MQLGDSYTSGQNITAGVAALVFASLAFWFWTVSKAEESEEGDVPANGSAPVASLPADARRAGRAARRRRFPIPRPQPYEPDKWAGLVDVAIDGRLSDQDLLYLEAVLRNEGIPTVFWPHPPGRHAWGNIGPQYVTALLVDAEKLDAARGVRSDLFGDEWHGYQPRLAYPYADIPGRRESMYFISAVAEIVRDGTSGRWTRFAGLGYLWVSLLGNVLGFAVAAWQFAQELVSGGAPF